MLDQRSTAQVAMLTAAAMIGQQVAGKAVRDTLFLSNFPVTALPGMIAVASLVAIGVALVMTRVMSRRGPGRVVPAAFAISGLLLAGEWLLALTNPKAASIVVFLHMATLGPVLISGFWSLAGERFDPRSARRLFGRIAGFGTLGGLLGGLAGERMAAAFGVAAALPLLAALHLLCAYKVNLFVRGTSRPRSDAAPLGWRQGFRALVTISYLRRLVGLVLFVTVSAALVDYVFKSRAVEAAAAGPSLMQIFSLFYVSVSVLTFIVQNTLSSRALEHWGVGGTIGTLPAVVAIGSAGAILAPGLGSAVAARAGEGVLRNSLYRSGYEVIYTPVPVEEKRATKLLVDVGVERLGDAAGAGLIAVMLALGVGAATPLLLLAIGLALLTLWLTTRLQRGYVKSLETSLLRGAAEVEALQPADRTTRTILMRTLSGLDRTQAIARSDVQEAFAAIRAGEAHEAAKPPATASEELRSGDPARVRRALETLDASDRDSLGEVITLLGWDDVAADAVRALRQVAAQHVSELASHLLDRDEEFAVRRRIPRVLAVVPAPPAMEALIRGLKDPRFEVRYQCGRALGYLARPASAMTVERDVVMAAVSREVSVGRPVWESQRLLDKLEDDSQSAFLDEVLRERSDRSLEHVFTLLALIYPREPLRIAFRGLHTGDPMLRGTALEYVESILPPEIWQNLRAILDDQRPARSLRPQTQVVDDLLASNQSIEIWLHELHRRSEGTGGRGSE